MSGTSHPKPLEANEAITGDMRLRAARSTAELSLDTDRGFLRRLFSTGKVKSS